MVSVRVVGGGRRWLSAWCAVVLAVTVTWALGAPVLAAPAGTVVGWGFNFYGQVSPPAGLTGVTAIAAGGGHSLALKSDGTVVGWGDNSYGQASPPAGLTGVTAIAAG
ncbi:MAG: trimeric autotransporter adhesin [Streptosporangiaceae bacterium]|nr:trimeric autotransporter adhesin [Streptosporangiaceae bacterium]